jgi:hypothetical protein
VLLGSIAVGELGGYRVCNYQDMNTQKSSVPRVSLSRAPLIAALIGGTWLTMDEQCAFRVDRTSKRLGRLGDSPILLMWRESVENIIT